MTTITVITDAVAEVDGAVEDGAILLDESVLADAIGWELKPEGLCREGICVPVRDPASVRRSGRLDLAAVCAALGRPAVIDGEVAIAAVALASEQRRRTLDGLVAAPFTLPDLDGTLHGLAEWRGNKKLLVAFSTW